MARPRDPERARRRRRGILLIASIPIVIFVVLVAGKLLSLSIVNGTAMAQYDRGDYDASEQTSSSLLELNLVETWIPYFNRADAKAADEDYTSAIDDFEKALDLAPDDKRCMVAVNLAHSWETLGDIYEQGGYHQGAVQLYQAAEDVLASMGDSCEPPDDAADQFEQEQSDIAGKKAQAEANQQADEQEQPGGETPDDKLDDLGDKQQQSDQDKANGDSRDRSDDDGGSGYVEKPW
jgi:tetratricopeptide (TPR) repeat protein